jgi:hypothetical protein
MRAPDPAATAQRPRRERPSRESAPEPATPAVRARITELACRVSMLVMFGFLSLASPFFDQDAEISTCSDLSAEGGSSRGRVLCGPAEPFATPTI